MTQLFDCFIIGHDSSQFPNLYETEVCKLLVGNKPTESFAENVVCNNLPINLEKFPYLCSFTGWYAIYKNMLYTKSYISLLEYDISVSSAFNKINNQIICSTPHPCVIGYSNTITDHYVFTKSTPWLELSLKNVYGIDLHEFVERYGKQFPTWLTTTNLTMHIDIFKKFCEWFEPMTLIFREHQLGAYVHERAFFIFCVLNSIPLYYVPNIIDHKQNSSHNIHDIYGKFLESKGSQALTNDMINEYYEQYLQSLTSAKEILTSQLLLHTI